MKIPTSRGSAESYSESFVAYSPLTAQIRVLLLVYSPLYTAPMELPAEDVEEFRVLYQEHYGEEITHDEAREMATNLLLLGEFLLEPLPGEEAIEPGTVH